MEIENILTELITMLLDRGWSHDQIIDHIFSCDLAALNMCDSPGEINE